MVFYWHDDDLGVVGELSTSAWESEEVVCLGAVYQDLGNTCFTFLVSPVHHKLDKQQNSRILLDALRSSFNINGEAYGRNDLVYGPDRRKFSGSAYQSTRHFDLHHGTLITRVDTEAMKKYLNPNKEKLLSKGVNSVQARVINLSEVHPSINHQNLCSAIEKSYRQAHHSSKIGTSEILSRETLDSIPELKRAFQLYSDAQWRFGQTFSFTHEYEKRFPWGTMSIGIISERDGLIHTCEIYSDALYVNMINRLKANLVGQMYTGENVRSVCQRTREQLETEQERAMIDDVQSWILTQI